MAFSGVTSVKFTAAPGWIKKGTKSKKERGTKEKKKRGGGVERKNEATVHGSFFPDNCPYQSDTDAFI